MDGIKMSYSAMETLIAEVRKRGDNMIQGIVSWRQRVISDLDNARYQGQGREEFVAGCERVIERVRKHIEEIVADIRAAAVSKEDEAKDTDAAAQRAAGNFLG